MKLYEDKEYREMCEGAEELQEIAKTNPPTTGAYLLRHLGQSDVCVDEHGRFWIADDKFQIFSQEDLQEMVNKYLDDDKWVRLANTLNQFIHWWDRGNIARGKLDFMVKLWLAFVMHEKFNKKWMLK